MDNPTLHSYCNTELQFPTRQSMQVRPGFNGVFYLVCYCPKCRIPVLLTADDMQAVVEYYESTGTQPKQEAFE